MSTAIDVVLLPSPPILRLCKGLNEELEDIDFEEAIPHITLLHAVTDDEWPLSDALESLAAETEPLDLEITGVHTSQVQGKPLHSLDIAETPRLLQPQKRVREIARPHIHYDAAEAGFSEEVTEFTRNWLANFPKALERGYWPHITLGFGGKPQVDVPIPFTADKLALCQTGEYLACKKILAEFQLARSSTPGS